MTKLVKTDYAIVPATSLAGKVEEALADEGKLAQTVGAHSKCGCQHLREDHAWTGDEKCLINGCTCPRFQMRLPIGDKKLHQQAKVERFGMNAFVQGLAADNDKITKDLREWAMQSERVAERKNFVGIDFEALELRTLAASLVPTVTLPTESLAESFAVELCDPVELSPEVEMPDLRVGCGAEFSVPVNGKTLRCTKWRGHSGDHSDKINGVPINWANK